MENLKRKLSFMVENEDILSSNKKVKERGC